LNAPLIKRLPLNTAGRDFIVGDVHGHFAALNEQLYRIKFNRKADRLISVGDLVDRGPQSEVVLDWLDAPWFHAVAGNHEQMCAMYAAGDVPAAIYSVNGGSWFIGKTQDERYPYARAFIELPFVIELETTSGLVGVVHAACDYPSWEQFKDAISDPSQRGMQALENSIWGRGRIESRNTAVVEGVRAVVVGHTPSKDVTVLGNVHHIDTGAWLKGGHFTLLNAETLQPE
jgi:serine/threonine protein phosphatase 1